MSPSVFWAFLAGLMASILPACAPPTERSDSAEDRILEERTQEYLDQRFRFYPVEATGAGLDAHDGELGQFEASQIASRVGELRDLRQRLLGIDLTGLSRDGFVDALWLTSAVKAELFELEEMEPWRRSPRFYSDILCRGVSSLLEPWREPRVEALVSRLDQVPILLQAAVDNLESPSPLSVEEGIADFERCRAAIAHLPGALAGFSDDVLAGEIQRAAREAQEHIQAFMVHLESSVPPAGPDSFRWGEEKLRIRLLYRDMEETPLQTIRLIAERHLSGTKETTKTLAASLGTSAEADPPVSEAPAPDGTSEPGEGLVSAAAQLLEELSQFVSESDMMVSLPEASIPPVQISPLVPPHAAGSLAAPGPLAPSGGAVFLLAPPPEQASSLDPARPVLPYELRVLAMREVYPGRYFRLLAARDQAGQSDLRRLVSSQANREGWAHYAEMVLLDEGYARDDPRLRLAALHRALLEQTRLVTAILLHAEDLSLATAAHMFMNEAFLDPSAAEREARMIALDPGRMSAALGKLQIMKLRRDFVEAEGDAATLRDFHEAFLSCGELPLRLVRLLLLSGGESQTLED